jgi:ribosome recycling factor
MLKEIHDNCNSKMQGSVDHMHRDFKTLRTGKVLISVLDNVKIDYYGTPTPLDQVGSVIATDATTIVINPWEKNLLSDVESAIFAANIGVNPNNDGDVIKLFFPPMTVEQRQESVKQMKGMGENAKVSVRNDRRDANDKVKKLEKEKEITSDESKAAQDAIQKTTDKFIALIDSTLKEKEQEILKV